MSVSGGRGEWRSREQGAGQSETVLLARGKEAVVTDFDKAFGQDAAQKTLQELVDGQTGSAPGTGVGAAEAKGDAAVTTGKDAVVGEGNTEDVGSQILESSQAIANGLAVNNPFLSE